jgi:membrane protein
VATPEGHGIRLRCQRCLELWSFHRLLCRQVAGACAPHRRCHRGLGVRTGCRARGISAELGRLLGLSGGEFIKSILERPSDPTSGATATIVGVVSVLITASGVFGEMRTVLNATFKVKPLVEPIFSLSRAASLASWARAWLHADRIIGRQHRGISDLEQRLPARSCSAVYTAVSFAIFTLLVAAIYGCCPIRRLPGDTLR